MHLSTLSDMLPHQRATLLRLVWWVGLGTACHADNAFSPGPPDVPVAVGALATAQPLSFLQIAAGTPAGQFSLMTCGLASDHRVFCWGSGILGDGSAFTRRSRPRAIAGDLRFLQISVGGESACGVTLDFHAYCWGDNQNGQLGIGDRSVVTVPVPVTGGLRFRRLGVGAAHACGVSYPDQRAYCWGFNGVGQLGDGTRTTRMAPVRVAGGLTFQQVSPGSSHTCGVTTDSLAFCWGANGYGQLGDSSGKRRTTPVLVAGGHRFRQIDAGTNHTCAVTLTHRAFCWGDGRLGQVGDGKTALRLWPRAVAGNISFDRVTAGDVHSCGEGAGNRAYCWGDGGGSLGGELGDGTTNSRLTPVAVTGGLLFTQLSAGNAFTCGITADGTGYCWGYNGLGSLGDGTTTSRRVPTPVAGPS